MPDLKKLIPWKLFIIFLVFSAVIILLGIYYYKSQKNRIFKNEEDNLSAIESLKINQIENWQRERLGDASVIRLDKPLIRSISNFLYSKNSEVKLEINEWMESLINQYDYKNVIIADTLLKVRLSIVSSDTILGDSIRKEMKASLKSHSLLFTDFHSSSEIGYIHLDLLIPLFSYFRNNQEAIGVIILRIDPRKILYPLIQSWPTKSKSSETLLLRREGDSVFYLNELRHARNTALNLKLPLSNKNLLATKAVNGLEGLTEGIDYRNIPVIGCIQKIQGTPWYMIAKVDKEEILMPLRRYSIMVIMVIILLILINASIFGFWIWQQRIKFYKNKLKNELSIRELEERFTTAFRMSPVSVTISKMSDNKFLDINNTFLNDMGYTREQVIGRTAKELDIWANESERQWIINEISEKGKIFGKVIGYKTCKGEILYGLSSMAVIKVNGEPCNLSTVVNITESKNAEEQLKLSEEVFRKLFENMLNGFAYCKMIIEDGKPLDFLYLNVNKAFADLTGLMDVIGKRASEAIPGIQEADPELLERYNRVSLTGTPEVFETYVESLKMWFSISVYSPQKGYFVAVFDVITARKLAEEKLHESRALLQSIIDNSNSLIYIVDTEGQFVMLNKPLQNLLAPVGSQLIGQTREAFLPKEIADIHRKNDLEVISSGKTQIFEEENQEPDGKHHYLTTKFPLYDNENNIYAVGGLSTDITERKKIENTLKESEDKFRNAFLINPDSITITRLDDGKYVSINDGFTKIFEYSEKEVLGKTPFDISIWFNPYDRKQFIKSLETIGRVENLETRFYSKSRKLIDCLVSATTITIEGAVHVLSTTRDITERKLVELALLESEERFRTLYENVTIGIYRTTSEGHILMANPALLKMLGFDSFEDLAHRNLEHEGYEPDYPRSEFMQTIEKEGKIIGLESAWNKRNGNTLFVRESAKAVKDADGNILYFDGTVEDITDRKKTEEALRESEDKFKYVFDHSVAGKSITFPSGEIHVNKAFCEMTGYSPEELINTNWKDISYPDDIKLTEDELGRLISGEKKSTRFIKRYIHKNGDIIWADVGTALRRDENGKPLYFMTTAIDITERKLAEVALSESEERFAKSFRTSPISFMIATIEDGRIIEVNDAFTTLSGYTREEAISNTTLNLKIWVNEKDRQNMIDSLRKGIAILHKETLLRAKGGNISIVLLSAQLIILGNRNCIISSIEDITKRKEAEAEVRIQSEIMSHMAEAVYLVRMEDGIIVYANSRFEELFGYSSGDMTGKPVSIVNAPTDKSPEKIAEEILAELGKKGFWTGEVLNIKKDGTVFWSHANVTIFDHSKFGKVLVSVQEDITGRKNAELQIKRLNEELERRVIQRTELLEAANKELEAFSYSVSHDLRAPLRSVHGFTKILLEDYESKLDDEGKRICGIISSSATQMGELIDDLLSFSRIGRSRLNPSLIDMKKMVMVIFEGMTSPTERERIQLDIGKLQKAFGDVTLFGQVWSNLISNAIKYTSKSDISVIKIGSKVDRDMITYFIKDNGVGFDMQYAHKLFGVFQRLHSDLEFEGNGVGLAIVQRIVLKHGGKVWAEGKVGKGATFYFSLPVVDINKKTHDARHTTHG
jgi:PAS domain S-box-containing protein